MGGAAQPAREVSPSPSPAGRSGRVIEVNPVACFMYAGAMIPKNERNDEK